MAQNHPSGVIRFAFFHAFPRRRKQGPGFPQPVIVPFAVVEKLVVLNVGWIGSKRRGDDGRVPAFVLGDLPYPRLRTILTGVVYLVILRRVDGHIRPVDYLFTIRL